MRKEFLIKSDFIYTRLDRWIRKFVFDIPQSLIEKNIRKGNIKVNSKKSKSSYKLQLNDNLFSDLPESIGNPTKLQKLYLCQFGVYC